jgi:hypothetical protein
MVGIDISNGRARCRGCGQKIAKGEKRFWYIGGEYYGNPNIFYWHPRCFLEARWDDITGEEIIRDLMRVFLPLIFGDGAMPTILAMDLGR